MADELTGRIRTLSEEDAVAALAFVLDVEDAAQAEVEQLRAVEDRLAEAFTTTPDLSGIIRPTGTVTTGDLARTTLLYLAGQESSDGTRSLVARALDRPRREGQRDPLTIAIGGLVLLALKTDVELKWTTSGRWSFHFRLKPISDTLLADILGKLWALHSGDPGGGDPSGGDPGGGDPGGGPAGTG
ncbi:hypothetical protein [Frankia sp. Cr2]|uniref:hypothetical protein n=1 Tax=Frankia sp. Cr2 TaxID=3073932 RepID=UPI002AD3456E|nr:hypothetical protein [Frankia sp. Cr2]